MDCAWCVWAQEKCPPPLKSLVNLWLTPRQLTPHHKDCHIEMPSFSPQFKAHRVVCTPRSMTLFGAECFHRNSSASGKVCRSHTPGPRLVPKRSLDGGEVNDSQHTAVPRRALLSSRLQTAPPAITAPPPPPPGVSSSGLPTPARPPLPRRAQDQAPQRHVHHRRLDRRRRVRHPACRAARQRVGHRRGAPVRRLCRTVGPAGPRLLPGLAVFASSMPASPIMLELCCQSFD